MGAEENIQIITDTINWCRTDSNLSEAIHFSIRATRLYAAKEVPPLPKRRYDFTSISVTPFRSFEAAERLHREHPYARLGVHNFANAFRPGGGVLQGCSAQEEALCRCSTLYPVLCTEFLRENYYGVNRAQRNPVGSDAVIYTPDILIIKTDNSNPQRLEPDSFIKTDILTAAAPDLRTAFFIDDEMLFDIHTSRARHLLRAAADNNIDILILGAFGCGAFANDPHITAKAYKEILPEFDGYFKKIEFAVWCTESHTQNYDAFRYILSDAARR